MTTCLLQNNGIGFEFKLSRTIKDNFIHPDALYYWMIEPPKVQDWNAPFDLGLRDGDIKPTMPGQGIVRLPRECVRCSDGIYRTCAKVNLSIICKGKAYNTNFYVDKTLKHVGFIGSDLDKRLIKDNETN